MTIDKAKLMASAERAALKQRPGVSDPIICIPVAATDVLALLAEIERLTEQNENLLECRSAVNASVALENEALRKERVPAGLYRELVALRELRDQAKSYVDGYLQDEVEDADSCISEEQHLSAAALSESLMDAFEAHWDAAMAKEVSHG
ncbi:hypothetical protein ACIOVF_24130 [Pseudomonas sp. NPDC087612]|uniref:hypothetical protein n=1 Tax=Pseudomonas sp. NPDC087612 TaxID=3364441 RepID=UPI0037F2694C